MNNPVKMQNARKKFILTPAMRTNTRLINGLVIKAHSLFASKLRGSSPRILTKPPRGSQLRVNSVHFLSIKIFVARGGIPRPNSSTFIPVSRAVIKCPNSWTITTINRTMKVSRIPRKMDIVI